MGNRDVQIGGSVIGGALERALRHAGKAAGFAEVAGKIAPHVQNAVAWLGENWRKLLPLVGLAG
jgi:hypothetical protein